ncbi:MAG: TIGR00153 family protein [Candidatus Eisenbacteria bacterium]
MRALFELFGRSPFGPLLEHMQRVRECVVQMKPLFLALTKQDYAEVERIAQHISELEHQADVIKNDIRDHLPRSYFLPVRRADILSFLREQDEIADAAEDVAVLLTMRLMQVPPRCEPQLMHLVDEVLETCALAFEACSEFKQLLESGFGGPEAEKVVKIVEQVSLKEWEADCVQMNIARQMFKVEKEMEPVSIAIWIQVFGELGQMANHAENMGDLLRMMISRS